MKLLAFVALTLVCGTAAARDVGQIPANSDPKISTWFRTAKSPSGTACCDEADGYREGVPVKVAGGEPTVIFRSWWATSDGYHLSLVDPSDLRSLHLIWDACAVEDRLFSWVQPKQRALRHQTPYQRSKRRIANAFSYL